MDFDRLIAFLLGVLAMAGLAFWLWKSAGEPPLEP